MVARRIQKRVGFHVGRAKRAGRRANKKYNIAKATFKRNYATYAPMATKYYKRMLPAYRMAKQHKSIGSKIRRIENKVNKAVRAVTPYHNSYQNELPKLKQAFKTANNVVKGIAKIRNLGPIMVK